MTITGIWQNAYGSRMTLAEDDSGIFGFYESTKGSTGRYCVLGQSCPPLQSGPTCDAETARALALCIAWRSLGDEPRDASWDWVSVLGGQFIQARDGAQLSLNHLLVASSAFPGLCPPGVYTDKLLYHRMGDAPCDLARLTFASDLLPCPQPASLWQSESGDELTLQLRTESAGRLSALEGSWSVNGRSLPIAGLCPLPSPKAADGAVDATAQPRQALAFTLGTSDGCGVRCLGGWIEADGATLHLQGLRSQATSSADSYLQTRLEAVRFTRCASPGGSFGSSQTQDSVKAHA